MNSNQENIRLVEMGDFTLTVPSSLAFNPMIQGFDIRCWMYLQAHYERRRPVEPIDIAQHFNVPLNTVLDSYVALDIYGWIVIKNASTNPERPILCVSNQDLRQRQINNPNYVDNLRHYLSTGSERIKYLAQHVLSEIDKTARVS